MFTLARGSAIYVIWTHSSVFSRIIDTGLLNMLKDPFFHFRAVQEVDKNNLTVHMEIQDLFSKYINFSSSFKASMEIIIIGS